MIDNKHRVCPVGLAGGLDNQVRSWFQDPHKILKPCIEAGMTALDIGCGPGFFSIAMAQLVGPAGRVIASDLQDGMLQKLRNKIQGSEFENRITLHKCEADKIGVSEHVDFALAFYMVHEVPDQSEFFKEVALILKPNGKLLIVEPPFHVSKSGFEETIRLAGEAGFTVAERPKIFLGRAAVLKNR
jgi:ubiquinone/menaquinone biosynthesis C-methylase UbiE